MRRMLLGMLLVAVGLIAPAPAQAAPYSVLVFSKTAGFRHDSIAAGITAIQQLGAANNFTVTATEDASAFNDANLATFAVVIWLHTTGDVLDANQQAAFERYIGAGGGYAGIHAASSLNFGSVNVGATSAPQSVTITNTGTAAATISSITASTQFGQSNNCGSSLAAGASCTVNVTFTPTTPGGKSGTLTIGSLAVSPIVSLSGTGTTPTESNLALNKPATATHVQNYVPANAVDGNAGSYWESQTPSRLGHSLTNHCCAGGVRTNLLQLQPGHREHCNHQLPGDRHAAGPADVHGEHGLARRSTLRAASDGDRMTRPP